MTQRSVGSRINVIFLLTCMMGAAALAVLVFIVLQSHALDFSLRVIVGLICAILLTTAICMV